jgi:methylated-DNA-[protein]-cysteine S-methyltransferase
MEMVRSNLPEVSIYWTHLSIHQSGMYVAATENGLCYIGSPDASFSEMETWITRTFKNPKWIAFNQLFTTIQFEIADYLAGSRQTFTCQIDLHGTPFQQAVWLALLAIPYGETSSYSQIAERLGKPTAVRAVSQAIGANPLLLVIPCHRVIGKSGSLTGYRAGIQMKKALLDMEQTMI